MKKMSGGQLTQIYDIAGKWQNTDRANFRKLGGLAPEDFGIKLDEHVVDCGQLVFCPKGWTVLPDKEQIPSRVQGIINWNSDLVKLHLSPNQKGGKRIKGNELRKELVEGKVPVYTAHVLDYLLANPSLIPEEWKGKAIFFWGTIYRSSGGNLYVRYFVWGGTGWSWGCSWLDNDWVGVNPSAASTS
jgi:hypothetical protein